MTKARRSALKWFSDAGEVALFDAAAPSSAMRRALQAEGLIETCGLERSGGVFALTKFRISKAGREALAALSK